MVTTKSIGGVKEASLLVARSLAGVAELSAFQERVVPLVVTTATGIGGLCPKSVVRPPKA